ncbi:type II secretion system F family protein [Robbsia sp. Bb-Pol-6]|uniref:Type II secretion system F family protein n=1 Tax=Robbsia betulipollinis TaxID=2981849 RepID=A0ABT3ZPL3_9BURK|nr:type II secretion system F family protein [Robbsia betulipollinis]MCY0388170.1 type II secretion system F family protein [Robbsia betulipollinis]
MSARALLLCAALLLGATGILLLLAQRAGRRIGRAAGDFVAPHLRALPAARQTDAPAARARGWLAQRPLERLPAIENLFLRAGIHEHSRWLLLQVCLTAVPTLVAGMLLGLVPAGFVVLLAFVATWFRLWLMISRRHRRIVRQLPPLLDALVRQVSLGTSLGSAFQQIAEQSPMPLGELVGRAAQLNRAGVELDVALKQTARMYGVNQLLTIGAVLGVSTRFGGRSDQILTRIADFMRDIEHAHQELLALSSETRISAWVLGLLPLTLVCGLMIFNNRFFAQMWNDPMGAQMLVGAAGLQITGSFLLYRLAKGL